MDPQPDKYLFLQWSATEQWLRPSEQKTSQAQGQSSHQQAHKSPEQK